MVVEPCSKTNQEKEWLIDFTLAPGSIILKWDTGIKSNLIPKCIKFMFSKKPAKFDKMFTVDLTLCGKCQIDSEDFVNYRVLKKYELYIKSILFKKVFWHSQSSMSNFFSLFQKNIRNKIPFLSAQRKKIPWTIE